MGHTKTLEGRATWAAGAALAAALAAQAHDTATHGEAQRLVGANGAVYTGTLRDGVPHGTGTVQWGNGALYEGEWRDGRRHGPGVNHDAVGGRYEGTYRDGARHGDGVYHWPNGRRWEGQWRYGLRHGAGVEIAPDGTRTTGEWRYGHRMSQTQPDKTVELLEKGAMTTSPATKAASEAVTAPVPVLE